MNKGILFAAAAVLACCASPAMAGGATITVLNDLDVARPAATIAVPFADIARVDPNLRMYHVVVRDPKGRVLPAQITNYQHDHKGIAYDDLVFPYDFAAGEKRAVFTVEHTAAATPPEPACAYARVVAERHDQFHKDEEGEGLDLYSIGGSRGAGGTGVWDGRKLWTSDNFLKADVLSNGPRRVAFKLTYAPWDAGAVGSVSETKQFTIDCGRNFDTVESVFDSAAGEIVAGIGITEHPQAEGFPKGTLTKDPDGRWMSYWEENKDGGLGIAIILGAGETSAGFAYEPPAKVPGNGNHLLLVKAGDGVPVRYFTGSAWSKGGFFADRASWEKFVKEHAVRALRPLTITVGARP
jgi:hypothetical protein